MVKITGNAASSGHLSLVIPRRPGHELKNQVAAVSQHELNKSPVYENDSGAPEERTLISFQFSD